MSHLAKAQQYVKEMFEVWKDDTTGKRMSRGESWVIGEAIGYFVLGFREYPAELLSLTLEILVKNGVDSRYCRWLLDYVQNGPLFFPEIFDWDSIAKFEDRLAAHWPCTSPARYVFAQEYWLANSEIQTDPSRTISALHLNSIVGSMTTKEEKMWYSEYFHGEHFLLPYPQGIASRLQDLIQSVNKLTTDIKSQTADLAVVTILVRQKREADKAFLETVYYNIAKPFLRGESFPYPGRKTEV